MARARNIKPSIMDNEELAELGALHRLLFIYLWMLADREGRLEDRPKRIAAQALPYDRSADVDGMLEDLAASGFIQRYQVAGEKYIQITNFSKHQAPHGTERDGVIPDADGNLTVYERTPKGYATKVATLPNCDLTVKEQSDNALIPDSLIPDSKEDTPPRKRVARTLTRPDEVPEGVWQDFQALRKAKRAALTDTALDGIKREAEKAGIGLAEALAYCCQAGWQGFNAGWYADRKGKRSAAAEEPAWRTEQRSRMAEFAPFAAAKPPPNNNIIDMEVPHALTR